MWGEKGGKICRQKGWPTAAIFSFSLSTTKAGKSRRQLSCLPTTVKTTDGHADGPLNLPPIDIIIPFLLIYFLASHPRLLSPHSGIT